MSWPRPSIWYLSVVLSAALLFTFIDALHDTSAIASRSRVSRASLRQHVQTHDDHLLDNWVTPSYPERLIAVSSQSAVFVPPTPAIVEFALTHAASDSSPPINS